MCSVFTSCTYVNITTVSYNRVLRSIILLWYIIFWYIEKKSWFLSFRFSQRYCKYEMTTRNVKTSSMGVWQYCIYIIWCYNTLNRLGFIIVKFTIYIAVHMLLESISRWKWPVIILLLFLNLLYYIKAFIVRFYPLCTSLIFTASSLTWDPKTKNKCCSNSLLIVTRKLID